MNDLKCETCLFYLSQGKHMKQGECRRYPPRLNYKEFKTNKGIVTNWVTEVTKAPSNFPIVKNLDWCGEYRDQPKGRGE